MVNTIETLKKSLKSIVVFLSAVAFVALLYALADSLVSGIWPRFNGIIVYRFGEFLPRSLCIYFIFLLPISLLGLPFYYISKRLPVLRRKDTKAAYNVIGAAVSLIIPIILFEIATKPGIAMFKTILLIAGLLGISLIALIITYLIPLILSRAAVRLPAFFITSMKATGYVSLLFIAITFFSLTVLPEINRPPYNPEAPNLLVISIDTLRKDHLSHYGYDKIETPNIDAFLARGTRFDNAYCSSPWTLPSFGSFLTGFNPSVCDVNIMHPISKDMVTLTEILRDKGYRTECYNGNYIMYPELGFGRGFDAYLLESDIPLLYPFKGTRLYKYIAKARVEILQLLGKRARNTEFVGKSGIHAIERDRKEPFFIWCHFLDPHEPYTPPAEYLPDKSLSIYEEAVSDDTANGNERGDIAKILYNYDGEIRYVDNYIGRILEALSESPYEDNTIVLLFTDHGEEFYDHGLLGHGNNVYPEVADMVFSMDNPSINSQIETCNRYFSHIDIMPTLLDALGIEEPYSFQGDSFFDDLSTADNSSRTVLCEYTRVGADDIRGIRGDGYLYTMNFDTGEGELYDIIQDPGAKNNIATENSSRTGEFSRGLTEVIDTNKDVKNRFSTPGNIELTEKSKSMLKALGYM